jgi:hypothetical protein
MKAVILAKLPSASILDLTHNIAPGDILHGAFEIWRIRPYLPTDTILVGVVDPGVGMERKPIAIEFPGICCVGPDNGLFSYLLETEPEHRAVELSQTWLGLEQVSTTFHGRDIFAPAAAQLAAGTALRDTGPAISTLSRLAAPRLTAQAAISIQGEILHIDVFGNLITSIGQLTSIGEQVHFSSWLMDQEAFDFSKEQVRIQIENADPINLVDTFGSVQSGKPLAYIGSAGLLEIAVSNGHAADTFRAQRGDPVSMKL